MGEHTGVPWAHHSWNPWQGCHKLSPACANCYMFEEKKRYGQKPDIVVRSAKPTFNLPLKLEKKIGVESCHRGKEVVTDGIGHTECLVDCVSYEYGEREICPSAIVHRERVFVCSWSDFFIEEADEWRAEAWKIMRDCPNLDFLLLTKRTKNIEERLPDDWGEDGYPNVWLGATVEANPYRYRIEDILKIPAARHFVSHEPAIEPVDFTRYLYPVCPTCENQGSVPVIEHGEVMGGTGCPSCYDRSDGLPKESLPHLDWIICGGESGSKPRPMHPDIPRSDRDQCKAAGISYYFKQWGEYYTRAYNMGTQEPVFRMFKDKLQWVHKGNTWVNGGVCVDAAGKVLTRGGDFDTATFPVAVMHRVGKHQSGNVLDGEVYEEYPK